MKALQFHYKKEGNERILLLYNEENGRFEKQGSKTIQISKIKIPKNETKIFIVLSWFKTVFQKMRKKVSFFYFAKEIK